jgi:hypothetical protein
MRTAPLFRVFFCLFVFVFSSVTRAQTTSLSDLDALRYIASHGDLIQVYGADPAKGRSHYQEYGVKEGRKITFDPLTYVASHPDLIAAIGVNEEQATRHYINFGFQEKRTTAGFNALAYISSYLDLMDAFGLDATKATRHYVEYGFKEGRRITFNALSYIASHPDLIAAFGIDEVAGARHFIQFGYKEGRRVSFDPSVYLSLHGDLQAAFGTDLTTVTKHYIQFGFKEGRAAAGPIIKLSASALAFESQRSNTTSPSQAVTVTNSGSSALTISSVTFSGSNADQFSQTNNCATVVPNGTCSVSVTFAPTSAGSKSATLVLTHNASGGSATVTLTGLATTGAAVTLKTDLEVLSYIASYADLIQAFGLNVSAGRSHYEDFGAKEGRRITFDALSYIASHGDLIGAFGTDALAGVRHFIQFGYKEGRRVSFDPSVYLSIHSDIRAAFGSDTAAATRHYIQFGFKEGRATVGQPLIQLSPSSIDFGSVQQGSSSPTRTILVANVGTASLAVTQISVGGASANQFSQTNNCTGVAAGATCTIGVTFTPTSTGSKSASISLSHNASGSPSTISLSGTGVADVGDSSATAAVSAKSLKTARPNAPSGVYWFDPDGAGGNAPFQTYADLTTDGGGWMQVRRVPGSGGWYSGNDDLRGTASDNASRATTYNFTSQWSLKFDYFVDALTEYMFAAGDGSAWCVLQRGNSNFNGMTSGSDLATQRTLTTTVVASFGVGVAAGGRTNVLSRVQPEDPWIGCEGGHDANQAKMLYGEASFSGYTSFKNSHNGINVFVRSGATAPTPAISVSPTSLSFSQTVNTTSSAQTVTVSNTGNATLTVSGVSLTGADATQFSQTNNCSSVAAGSSCTISVTFNPTSAGSKSASISISHNASGSPTTSSLVGTGIAAGVASPVISVSPTSISFGSQAVNATSAAQVITIRNTGSASLVVTSITSTDITQFPGSQTCTAANIAPNATCSISVSFKPSSSGAKNATVSITHNASGSPSTISLSGTGTAAPTPVISVNPTSLSFSQTVNTTSSAQTVTVSNTGNATLTVSGVSLTGADAGQFSQTNNCSSVAAGSSCTISVTFAPTSAGAKSASISITHNASGSPTTVVLSGTGTGTASGYSLNLSVIAEGPAQGSALSFSSPNLGGSVLDFKTPKRISLARVFFRVRNSFGAVIAEGYTDANGRVAVAGLDPAQTYRVGVASAALTPDGLNAWVVNNRLPLDTAAQNFRDRYGVYWVYADVSATSSGDGSVVSREMLIGAGYDAASRTLKDDMRSSGPFLLLNYVVQHQAFLAAAGAPSTTLPALTILWSPTNRAAGDNDTYKYDEGIAGGSGAFFQGVRTNFIDSSGKETTACPCTTQSFIYLSGSQATEPMELTSTVPVHELTHYTQRSTMRNASPGGPHSTSGEWQDFTLAQHEGFATGLALMVDGSSVGGRTFQFNTAQQTSFDALFYSGGTDYRKRRDGASEGWFQEGSFTSLIWRLFDPQGTTKLSASQVIAPFYSSAWTTGVWAPSPWAYGTVLKTQNPSLSGAIDLLGSTLNITLAGNDHWGTTETVLGNRSSSLTFPIYTRIAAGGSAQVCSVGTKAEYNKLSNRRYLRFDGTGTARTIRVTGATGTIPILYIDNPRQQIFSKDSNTASAQVTIPATGAYGWIGECSVVVSPSTSSVDRICSSQSYTPPQETCWTVSVSN